MHLYKVFYLISLLSFLIFGITFITADKDPSKNESHINVALRNSGHELLLLNNDSTSLILPIKKLATDKYQLAFQNELAIFPDSLESIIRRNFRTANLSQNFIVEIINCSSKEIVYSYFIDENVENTIVPCSGRNLPSNCYLANVYFQYEDDNMLVNSRNTILIISLLSLFIGLIIQYRKKLVSPNNTSENLEYTRIGNFKFFKHQNMMVKEKDVIELTAKECELMKIFSENLNQIIKRDDLVKKVWEDNGVVVGRSLDTYISKIRKKLKADDSIKLVNIHGVGYKLEISSNDSQSLKIF